MSRRSREERLAAKGRPKRRAAAKTHFFKYQLATDPSRAEADDLKRALEESLRTQHTVAGTGANNKKGNKGTINNNNSTNSSNGGRFNNSSNESLGSNSSATSKRTRSSTSLSSVASLASNPNKRPKLTNGHHNGQPKQCDRQSSIPVAKLIPAKTITTTATTTINTNTNTITTNASTSPPPPNNRYIKTYSRNQPQTPSNRHQMQSSNGPNSSTPIAKGTPEAISVCSPTNTPDLSSKKNQNQPSVKVTKKRSLQGSWSLIGVPEEKLVLLRDDESPKRLICYPAIRHVEGDVIQVRDSVLLRSGARKTDLPYIAKISAFWEDGETGSVMMSLFWYYRPEHTEEGRKPHHLPDEIFASRHRDVDSVECIEDKCYVLTFNEYCRYRKRCKMEKVNTTWSLADVTIPVSNESYPRCDRIPDSDVNPELVFCCRQIYDSRMRRLVKNPLINPKYGHI